MMHDAPNACREFVREEEALLLRRRVVQGGYRCYGSDVYGADLGETLYQREKLARVYSVRATLAKG